MANDDKAKAIAKVAEEVASVAVDSGSGCAYMVQRDAEKNPEFLLLFCDENAIDLQAMIDAVEGVTEGWFSKRPRVPEAEATTLARFLAWATKSGRVLIELGQNPATLLQDFAKLEKARIEAARGRL